MTPKCPQVIITALFRTQVAPKYPQVTLKCPQLISLSLLIFLSLLTPNYPQVVILEESYNYYVTPNYPQVINPAAIM